MGVGRAVVMAMVVAFASARRGLPSLAETLGEHRLQTMVVRTRTVPADPRATRQEQSRTRVGLTLPDRSAPARRRSPFSPNTEPSARAVSSFPSSYPSPPVCRVPSQPKEPGVTAGTRSDSVARASPPAAGVTGPPGTPRRMPGSAARIRPTACGAALSRRK
jgi:hypothetical protein